MIFKNKETNSDQRFRRATRDPPSKPPPRENYYVDKDSKLQTYKDLFSGSKINIDTYWDSVSSLYKFHKKQKEIDSV